MLVFVNDELYVICRMDLEDLNLEILWFEIVFFKFKRFFLLVGIYWFLFFIRVDDIVFENNIEKVDLLNKEIILIGDFNIDVFNF